mgnify:CR=1 FL=1
MIKFLVSLQFRPFLAYHANERLISMPSNKFFLVEANAVILKRIVILHVLDGYSYCLLAPPTKEDDPAGI